MNITAKLGFAGISCQVLKTLFAHKTCVYYTRNMRIPDIKLQAMARYVLAELPQLA